MAGDIQLDTLEARGLIRLAAIRPELEYLFRHWLVQDAAYGSLLKQERRDLHARVGRALETLYPERRSELAAVLAMHFEQAGDNAKAIDYLVEAGEYGYRRNAIREAYDAFERAARLLADAPPAAQAQSTRVRVALGKAETSYSFRKPEEVIGELEAIIPEAETLGDSDVLARIHMLVALGRLQQTNDPDDASVRRSLERIDDIGRQLGDPSLRALPLALIGMSKVFTGAPGEGVEALEESVPLLDRRADSIGAAFARGALAIGYAILGQFDRAEEASRHATEIAAKGDLIAQLDALIAEAIVRSARGDLEAAVPIARDCVDRAEQTGATACAMASSWVLGDAFHRLGRYAEAREVLERGTEISQVVDRKVWRPTLQAWLGSTLAALGERDEDWDDALATARSIGNRYGEAGILAKRAEAATARGDWEAALGDYQASAALFEAVGARPGHARALQAWGNALRSAGRADESRPVLERALAIFEELGLGREAAAVRTTLSMGGMTLTFG